MSGRKFFSASAISLAMLFGLTGTAAAPDPLAAPRAQFERTWARVAGTAAPAEQDSPALQRYVLYPYLRAARLVESLRTAGTNVTAALDNEIAAFLAAHEAPVVQELRQVWLDSLAARAKWPEFLATWRDATDGAVLRCHSFTARIELGQEAGLVTEIARAWLTPRSMPECERAFSWLDTRNELGPTLIAQRVRLALEAGNSAFARQIAARLPAEQAAPLLQWAALLENPQREIDALIAAPRSFVESGALHAGWTKYARADRTGAKRRFDALVRARGLDRAAASPLALALALALSWDRDADALRYFALVEAGDFDDESQAWRARAALWAGDWKQVARSIEAMSAAARGTARWRYWSARAAAGTGDDAGARRHYESILAEDNYYSAMAAARLGRKVAPDLQALPVDPALLASAGETPALVRARELRMAALPDKARAEWSFGLNLLQPAARRQSIRLAASWGWYEQAVATASGEGVFNDYGLLYPRPYDPEVAAAARRSGLPRHLIYAVIRQESLYQRDAVSSAQARGLMQLTLDTARRTARAWQRPQPNATTLFEPDVNVLLGSAHLKDLLDRFAGQLPVALAAYNAGPGAAQRWLPTGELDPDIWIENIPYNETRTYVQRILWHTVVFRWLQDRDAQDTRDWLRNVKPR